ncbi:GNAT family N-acetyltransferase [Photobacterium sanctipauli]|uniref:GNAT family N-acetyltransferase n=1 Tax=Photobacterium sanctipauli TaxID=1342794 RepID=A0A2T3NZX5_9GAMM|nr:GNAT family N-acetyltransferase [Photobacterium sanctipauli]PSW21800.1 GNAT family N-acetyltransferase [Photobacterium sanctipauli]
MDIEIGNSEALITKSQMIRRQVFVKEQAIPLELDLDGLDQGSYHALVTDQDSLVATARLTIDDSNQAHMARVAVLAPYRGASVATWVIKAMMAFAREKNVESIHIYAHHYLRCYYERLGYQYIKDAETVGSHQLIEMHHRIK